MAQLRRLVLVRHGETEGNSSTRFYGSTDTPLSPAGYEQATKAAGELHGQAFCRVVASPLQRSWKSAWVVGQQQPISIENDFREIDFGRWEGFTAEEIQASDPIHYEDWKAQKESFEFPNGEYRAPFQARVQNALDSWTASSAHSLLLVLHKGVIRVIVEKLLGTALDREAPSLGEVFYLTKNAKGEWYQGTSSSNPAALAELS